MKPSVLAVVIAMLCLTTLAACGDDADKTGSVSAVATLTAEEQALVAKGAEQYAAYVRLETTRLLEGTESFVVAYKGGDDDTARRLYAPTRAHWESIEPVAETFGDLDPRTDAREADLEEGEEWTGWHLLEKDLWPQEAGTDYVPLSTKDRASYADRLLSDLQELEGQVADATYTGEQIANGAKELLDEVANGKVTGEEEFWSHTDLYDFQANIDGARKAFEVLQPVVRKTDPDLGTALRTRFVELQDLLDEQREGTGFVSYPALSQEQVKAFSDAVNALAEPLSQLAAAVA